MSQSMFQCEILLTAYFFNVFYSMKYLVVFEKKNHKPNYTFITLAELQRSASRVCGRIHVLLSLGACFFQWNVAVAQSNLTGLGIDLKVFHFRVASRQSYWTTKSCWYRDRVGRKHCSYSDLHVDRALWVQLATCLRSCILENALCNYYLCLMASNKQQIQEEVNRKKWPIIKWVRIPFNDRITVPFSWEKNEDASNKSTYKDSVFNIKVLVRSRAICVKGVEDFGAITLAVAMS